MADVLELALVSKVLPERVRYANCLVTLCSSLSGVSSVHAFSNGNRNIVELKGVLV